MTSVFDFPPSTPMCMINPNLVIVSRIILLALIMLFWLVKLKALSSTFIRLNSSNVLPFVLQLCPNNHPFPDFGKCLNSGIVILFSSAPSLVSREVLASRIETRPVPYRLLSLHQQSTIWFHLIFLFSTFDSGIFV